MSIYTRRVLAVWIVILGFLYAYGDFNHSFFAEFAFADNHQSGQNKEQSIDVKSDNGRQSEAPSDNDENKSADTENASEPETQHNQTSHEGQQTTDTEENEKTDSSSTSRTTSSGGGGTSGDDGIEGICSNEVSEDIIAEVSEEMQGDIEEYISVFCSEYMFSGEIPEAEELAFSEEGESMCLIPDNLGDNQIIDPENTPGEEPLQNILNAYTKENGLSSINAEDDQKNYQLWRTNVANPKKTADLNDDGTVDVDDLLVLIGQWGSCDDVTKCSADLDGNGYVEKKDIIIMFSLWGTDGVFVAGEADTNKDSVVDTTDLLTLLDNWGVCESEDCIADINGDKEVNSIDLSVLHALWGPVTTADASGFTFTIELEHIANEANFSNVLGYYVNGNLDTFTPIFQNGDHPNYPNTNAFSSGDITQIEIPGVKNKEITQTIGFAINSFNHNTQQTNIFATENDLNPDESRHALVYDIPEVSEEYIIAFEDMYGDQSDNDFNDMVIRMTSLECSMPDGDGLEAPTLISPTNGSTLTTNTVNFDWNSVENADQYKIEVMTSTSGTSTVIEDQKTASTTFQTNLNDGSYSWRVKAFNEDEMSPWSSVWQFSIDTSGGNGGNGGGNGGSGGGGGGGGGFSDDDEDEEEEVIEGQILGTQTCSYLNDFLHLDWENDPAEVAKLQLFLRDFEGYNIDVTGTFDQNTFNTVVDFQERYASEVLLPWGYRADEGTGFVYITTKNKINEIVCRRNIALTTAQQEEINEFKTSNVFGRGGSGFAGSDGEQDQLDGEDGTIVLEDGEISGTSSLLGSAISDIAGTASRMITSTGANALKGFAAAAMNFPTDVDGWGTLAVVLLLILILVYLVGSAIVNSQDTEGLSQKTVWTRKILVFIIGIIIAGVIVFLAGMPVLVTPLLIVLIILAVSLLWLINEGEVSSIYSKK